MPGFNVPYAVGDKLGRDCQLWPTILRSELLELQGGDTPERRRELNGSYPVGLTQQQMMGLAWRVQTWKISGAAPFSIGTTVRDDPVVTPDDFAVRNDSGNTADFSFSVKRRQNPPDVVPQIDLASERDMLADWRNFPLTKDYYPPSLITPTPIPLWKTLRNLGVQDAANYNRDDPENPFLIQVTDTFSFSEPYNHTKFGPGGTVMINPPRFFMDYRYVIYDPDAKLFYPQIFLGFGGFAVFYFMLDSAPVSPGTRDVLCGHLTVSFGSTGIPSFQVPIIRTVAAATSQSGTYPGTGGSWTVPLIATGSFDLTMTPTKFWPYQNGLGELVYAEDDGHQIHDPFA